MSKEECFLKLSTVSSCYAMGILSLHLISTVNNNSIPPSISFKNLLIPERIENFSISKLKKHLANEQDRMKLISEFSKSIVRTFIHNTYEVVLEYAIETNQKQKLFNSELMTFTRLLRNNVGHDHKFRFRNERERQRLRNRLVTWRGKEITLEMEGKQIPIDLVDHASVTNLLLDILNFVQKELD